MTAASTPSLRADGALRQSSLRDANLALICRTLFALGEPASRADLAARTGMTRSTVSRLTDDLVAGGFLSELPRTQRTGPGRPAVPLTPASQTMVAIGMEVNVAHLAVRIADLTGAVLHDGYTERPCADQPPGLVLGWVKDMVHRALDAVAGVPVVAAHLALPGLVDRETGALLNAPNLGWTCVQPADHLACALPVPLQVGNEAEYAAWTVLLDAPGRVGLWPSFLYVSGETGIGGAHVHQGRVMRGERGWAGEIGHLTIDPEGPQCSCGSRGCLERYVGLGALLEATSTSGLDELLVRLRASDEQALTAAGRAATALGVGLSDALNLLDVPRVVLGGHLAALAEWLMPTLQAEVNLRVMASRWRQTDCEVVSLDPSPASKGAAWMGLHAVIADPAGHLLSS